MRAQIDDAIDDSLLADLDEDTCLADIAIVIAKSAGLQLDLAKVTDELLGMVTVDRSEPQPPDSDPAGPTHPRLPRLPRLTPPSRAESRSTGRRPRKYRAFSIR